MVDLLLALLVTAAAVVSMRTARLTTSVLALAVVSAGEALLLYRPNTTQIAILELSVALGLVAVLLLFALSATGNAPQNALPTAGSALIWLLTLSFGAVFGVLLVTGALLPTPPAPDVGTHPLWHEREGDVLLHVALLFNGALGVRLLLRRESRAASEAV